MRIPASDLVLRRRVDRPTPSDGDRGGPTPRCTCGLDHLELTTERCTMTSMPPPSRPRSETLAVSRETACRRGRIRVGRGDGGPRRPTTSDRTRDLGPLSARLAAYFDGGLAAIDDLPVEQPGGDFFQAAWKVMREVPAGETITYAELAERAGRPRAVPGSRQRLRPQPDRADRAVSSDPSQRRRVGGYYYGSTPRAGCSLTSAQPDPAEWWGARVRLHRPASDRPDDTPYRLLTTDGVSVVEARGPHFLRSRPRR